jgi:hypothetical protein
VLLEVGELDALDDADVVGSTITEEVELSRALLVVAVVYAAIDEVGLSELMGATPVLEATVLDPVVEVPPVELVYLSALNAAVLPGSLVVPITLP